MAEKPFTILLVEDNAADAYLIEILMSKSGIPNARLEKFARLSEVQDRLAGEFGDRRNRADLVLLDLGLPDSQGAEGVARLVADAPELPIIVLTGNESEAVALEAIQAGAQDYLVKGTIHAEFLTHSIRYAVERHRLTQQVRDMATRDELTGTLNRRGFMNLAEHSRRLALRARRNFSILFLDLNGLKHVNDTQGHDQGDQMLRDVGAILHETFRDSDIVGRMGGDEFCVLLETASPEEARHAMSRLEENLERYNRATAFPISMSAGLDYFDSQSPQSLEEMIRRADREMYANKVGTRGRKAA